MGLVFVHLTLDSCHTRDFTTWTQTVNSNTAAVFTYSCKDFKDTARMDYLFLLRDPSLFSVYGTEIASWIGKPWWDENAQAGIQDWSIVYLTFIRYKDAWVRIQMLKSLFEDYCWSVLCPSHFTNSSLLIFCFKNKQTNKIIILISFIGRWVLAHYGHFLQTERYFSDRSVATVHFIVWSRNVKKIPKLPI